ncbi:hypothetical protein [Sphingomonas sp. 28-63-12]|uniref:hypothetical protein n=1 Tax=Sphingomonas sp. 28-63-12 TaxID=1970434 RepID=UPI000BD21A52|nr:MAG: hypothetical protein B7Y47_11145 [Sphingomonas sp. 28-63-12]
MPLLQIRLTPGCFDNAQRDRFVAAVSAAAAAAESLADTPVARLRTVALVEQLAPGHFYLGGQSGDQLARGAFVLWQVSAGVLDGARKARFAAALQAAADAEGGDDPRTLITSCVIDEVPEGQWAQNGTIRRLPEAAALAGFTHLADIALP